VLEGASGTLAELAMLWALARAGALEGTIVLLDPAWAELTGFLTRHGRLDRACQRVTRSVETPEQAVLSALGREERR
jgi:predicted Rossmann-fold nucleotide-binding protein